MAEPDEPTPPLEEEPVLQFHLPHWMEYLMSWTQDDGSQKTYIPLPENHPFYAMIGKVASQWAHLEHILDCTIWELLGSIPQVEAACVTSQLMGVRPRCQAIISLCTSRGIASELIVPVKRLMNDAHTAGDWRNRWVHDSWWYDLDTKAAGQFRSMAPIDRRFGIFEMTESSLADTLSAIRELMYKAMRISADIHHALEASRRMSPSARP